MRVCWNYGFLVESVCKLFLRLFLHIVSITIQSYIKACFFLTYILLITQKALHQIFNVTDCTIDVVEYFIYFFGLLTLKSSCFLYLLVTKWPYICQQWRAFSWFYFMYLPFCIFLLCFFLIFFLPINSLRFLFGMNVVIGWQSNISFRDISFIAGKFQDFPIISLIFGQKWL